MVIQVIIFYYYSIFNIIFHQDSLTKICTNLQIIYKIYVFHSILCHFFNLVLYFKSKLRVNYRKLCNFWQHNIQLNLFSNITSFSIRGSLALLYLDTNDSTDKNKYFEDLLSMMPNLEDEDIPNELLYGRSGYLFTLLYIKTNVDEIKNQQHTLKLDSAISKVRFMSSWGKNWKMCFSYINLKLVFFYILCRLDPNRHFSNG